MWLKLTECVGKISFHCDCRYRRFVLGEEKDTTEDGVVVDEC